MTRPGRKVLSGVAGLIGPGLIAVAVACLAPAVVTVYVVVASHS